ncbi:hypothetical protein EMMF5_005690 [Cystobasidiomycetes sp. EMM_F5]
MAGDRLDIAKKQHRERGQLKHRQRLGLLEKHGDYVKRAKDFHSKEDRIKKLRQKASTRNKDEFYFGMVRGKTEKGVHIQDRGNVAMPTDVVKLLKTQDAGYVRTLLATEEKLIQRLKNELGATVAFHSNAEQADYSDSEDDDMDRQEGTSKQSILSLIGVGSGQGRKTVFVQSAKEAAKYKPKSNLTVATTQQDTRKGKGKALPEAVQGESLKEAEMERNAHLSSLSTELVARQERLALLRRTAREMEVQRAIMGKGSKMVVGSKNAQLDREAERLNENDLDELELKRLGSQKRKLPTPEVGIATGARTWKWKAERKR